MLENKYIEKWGDIGINQDGSKSINKSSRERRVKCQMSANMRSAGSAKKGSSGQRDERTGQDRE